MSVGMCWANCFNDGTTILRPPHVLLADTCGKGIAECGSAAE